ncbi:MAG: MG2 domain-containing protein, partial [Calditrichaceae bacterium]
MKRQNHIPKFQSILFIFLLTISICMISCESETDTKRGYSLETAKMVSQAPSAIIASDQNITVVFVSDMVKKSQVGVNLKKEVFNFTPSIDGITVWQDRRTLIFNPNESLPMRAKYTGSLDLNALFPEYKDKNLENLPIEFEVAGREIEKFSSDLKLKMENDPKFLLLDGQVIFTEPVDFSRVEKSSSLYLGNKRLVIKWSEGENKKQYKFITDAFARTKKTQQLKFKLKKELLEISYDMDKTIEVPALTDLTVTDIIRDEEGTQPDLKIEFSDELKSDQDIRGFISIKPELDIKLSKMGKTILVGADFDFGETYTLTIKPGIRSRWATTLTKEFSEEIQFDDMVPEMKFANAGVFLPSNNQKKIAFLTVNVRKVELRVQKVFESNLGQFLQMEGLDGAVDRRDGFGYQINRVGIEVAKQDLYIGETKNRWLQHEIDLKKLIPDGEKGLFLVEISFEKKDMIYDTSEENMQYRRGRNYDYYNDPASRGYIWRHGRIYKPIAISDIGLIYKKGNKSHHVYATNLITAAPLSGVHIQLITYQHQLIAENYTDGEGLAVFEDIKEDVFYVEAEKDGQRSVIKPNEMSWNLSTFDTGGDAAAESGIQAFIYADRGVHRPGDTVYLSTIIRNENNTFPKDHPVSLEVKNPKNQTVFEQTNRKGTDGFYTFQFTTDVNDLTGNYRAILTAGSKKFYHTLRIETVVPERLKINLETTKDNLSYEDKLLDVKLNSIYLFGNPASNLDAEITVSLSSIHKSFKKYSDYNFTNQTLRFQRITSSIFKGKLDAQGNVSKKWTLPDLSNVPGAIQAVIKGEVWEKGGRSSKNQIRVSIDPYPNYVGIKRPKVKWGYLQTGQEYEAPVILLSPDGKEVAGRTLQYRIYRSRYYWWWEYDSRDEYQLRYKKDRHTRLVDKGTLVSGTTPVMLKFKPEERGQYLIEVQDDGNNGHTAAFFIHAYAWGQSPAMGKDAGILAIKTDKAQYNPGDKAIVSFPTPENSTIL